MLGLDSGTAAADSESEGIWAMMATARGERGGGGASESGARYHLIRVIIGMEGNAHHTGWNGMEGRRTTRRQARSVLEGEVETAAQRQTSFFPQLVMMM